MSYILEALRKSERERLLNQAPSLPSLIVDAPPRRQRWLPWLIVLLLAFNGAVLVYLWLGGWGKTAPTAQPGGLDHAAKLAETSGTRNLPRDQKVPEHPGDLKEAAGVKSEGPLALESADKPPPQETPAAVAKAAKEPAMGAKAAPAKKPTRRPRPIDSATQEASEVSEDADPGRDVGRLAAMENWPEEVGTSSVGSLDAGAPVTETPERPSTRRAIPLLSAMPRGFQQRIPAMKVNVLAYSSVPDERFAVIDMVKYNKGARLPSGVVLVDIRPDGLILELDGTRFRLSQ